MLGKRNLIMKDKKELFRAIKFTLFSISAGIIQILVFTLIEELFNLKVWINDIISISASVIWNFTFNRKFTFKSSNDIKKSMLLVAIFYLFFIPISGFLGDIAEAHKINEYIILAITMISNFVLEYLYTRYIVYRNSCDTIKKNEEENSNL